MNPHLLNTLLSLTFLLNEAAANPSPDPPAGEARLHQSETGQTMPYRLFTPESLTPGKQYPVVLCFHGAKGRGDENLAAGSLAYPVLTAESHQQKHPAFIIAPQCPEGRRWVDHHWGDGAYDSTEVTISEPMTLALEILDAVIDELPIDPSRIYVTGRSMGGFGTWDAIARRPDLFAAAIPIAGGGDSARAKDWVDLPIWTIASDGDKTCPVSGTRVVVEALKQAGGNITYTEHPTKSHGEICQAWADIPELHDWLFAQRK